MHLRGLADATAAYPQEESALADAVTYADQTTGPDGQAMSVAERVADMLRRHGPQSPNARAHPRRTPYLQSVAERVQGRISLT